MNLTKIISICFALFNISFIKAQYTIPYYYDTLERNQEINFNLPFEYSSSSISNKLITHFIQGGEIPESVINKQIDNHKQYNRVGINLSPSFEYINYKIKPFKSKNWGLITKAGALYNGVIKYQEGLFGLAFHGNQPYLGKKIDLSNMSFNFIGAHKFGIGLIDAKTKSNVSLNIYGITNYLNTYTNDAHFSQDETGFDAELLLSGKFENAKSSSFYKGYGVGIDANFFFNLGSTEKPTFLQFSIQNLGVGFLNDNVVRQSLDTTLNQNGYKISQLINNETLFNSDKTVADEIGLEKDTISKTLALPFTVQIGKIIDEHNKKPIQFYYGARVYVQNGALPMAYLGGQYRSKKWFRAGIGASYGGFTGFRANMYVQAVGKNFNIGLSTHDIAGAIGMGKGQAYSLSLSRRF